MRGAGGSLELSPQGSTYQRRAHRALHTLALIVRLLLKYMHAIIMITNYRICICRDEQQPRIAPSSRRLAKDCARAQVLRSAQRCSFFSHHPTTKSIRLD